MTPCIANADAETCPTNDVEYQQVAATPTSDAICRAASVCTRGEYKRFPLLAARDRVCVPLIECVDTEYEAVPATPTSQREVRLLLFFPVLCGSC